MKTVIAPIDFSPATEGVIAAAITLARSLRAHLEIIHALPALPTAPRYQAVVEDLARLAQDDRRHANARLHEIRLSTEALYRQVSTHLLTGDAATVIADYAREKGADYLVVGSNGHGAVYDLIVGSTTQALLKKSPCPVVSVPTTRDVTLYEPRFASEPVKKTRATPRARFSSLLTEE
jgi:nucleotide-binding universal stress UspA family protein